MEWIVLVFGLVVALVMLLGFLVLIGVPVLHALMQRFGR